jgi:hypothetical protein
MPASGSPAASSRCEAAARLGARGEVAQSVEHTAENRGVAGSIPALATWARGDPWFPRAVAKEVSKVVGRGQVGGRLTCRGFQSRIRSAIEQLADEVAVAVLGGGVQSSEASCALAVDIGAGVEEPAGQGDRPDERGGAERRDLRDGAR